MMRKFTMVIAAAACAVSLAACSSSEEKAQEATQENNAELCASLEGLRSQLDAAGAGAAENQANGEEATLDQARESLTQLGEAFNAISENSDALSASVQEQFDLAQQQYQDELAAIDDDTPLPEALSQAKTARENLNSQYEQILAEVGCE